MNKAKYQFGTTTIHGGHEFNETHAHTIPIYQSSTYFFDSIEHGQALWKGEEQGYIYGRISNPNVDSTAQIIASLEGLNLPQQPVALMTSSGMSAVSTVALALAEAGDTIITQYALYGGSYGLFHNHLVKLGITHQTFSGHDLDDLDRVIEQSSNVRAIVIESPANPTLRLTDIRAVVERAHAIGALVVVDNTFATPYLQRPFEMGADIVIHSTTKYLTGHGTVVGGAIVTPHQDLLNTCIKPALIHYGGIPGPMSAWLTEMGLKTLHIRMERHCQNAMEVARYLENHSAVERVYYPGLESFEQYELAQVQMDDFGGMISFELKGGCKAGETLMNEVELCTLAVSLGAVDTLIQHPASMTHFHATPEDRAKMEITDGLVRLSVGIEDVQDIVGDLEQALSRVMYAMSA